jgi:cytochrome c biogenesis protein CcdA/thiol-disulfide isomerase/thioredoxin
MILLIISFLAGVLTILAPCTLPLLPIIVGSSVNGQQDKKKPFIIAGSLGVSVILFTLLLKSSTFFIHIPQQTWSLISGSIIIIFGLISLFPGIWERLPFVAKLNLSSNRMLATGYKRDGIIGDIIIGASLGPVFSTCSPTYFVILATVLPQSFFLGFMYLLAYAIGLSGVLLLVAFLGQKIVDKLGGVSDTHGWFKRTLGLLFLIIGIAVVFGVDKVIERKLLESGLGDITKVEQKLLGLNKKNGGETLDIPEDPFAEGKVVDTTENSSTTVSGPGPSGLEGKKVLSKGPKSPDLLYPSGFINTDGKSITIAQYKGKKVVLLDIWTYSCINCQRTIPYINAWYEKYKPYGLEVIGLHTPEFAFEKVQKNVEEAVKGFYSCDGQRVCDMECFWKSVLASKISHQYKW